MPLDDCLYALQPTITQPNRSSLHRCLGAHGISRLPEVESDTPRRKRFDSYPIGLFHIDLAEVTTAEGKLYLFVAIDRTSKFAVVEFVEKADMRATAGFLETLLEAIPYRIHSVLIDNGIQFADLLKNRQGPTARFRGHPFDRLYFLHGIEDRLTKPNPPLDQGVGRAYERNHQRRYSQALLLQHHEQLKAHLTDFFRAYKFARRLKTLKRLTPYECKLWTQTPDRLTLGPIHQMPGINTYRARVWRIRAEVTLGTLCLVREFPYKGVVVCSIFSIAAGENASDTSQHRRPEKKADT